jgi:transposase
MYHYVMFNREEYMARYHKRSNAESVFSAVKAKLRRSSGDSVRPKCDGGQVNEVLTKVLCHNMCILIRIMRELGVETTFGAGWVAEPEPFV